MLTLGVAARDDVAVASVELHYTIDAARPGIAVEAKGPGAETGHVAVALPGLGTRAVRGEARLELAQP